MDGAGPPLIALHGAAGSGRDHFAAQRPVLADATSGCTCPDARGHGATRADVAERFATDDLAADVLAFADALGLETFHLLGYSLGAMTALHVAAQHVDRLRTLVVVSVAPDREPRLAVGPEAHGPGPDRAR